MSRTHGDELYRIYLEDNSRRSVYLPKDGTVRDLFELLSEKLGIGDSVTKELFGLCEVVDNGGGEFIEKWLPNSRNVTVQAACMSSSSHSLWFKIKYMKLPNAENLTFPYNYATTTTTTATVTSTNSILFTALQMQATFGNYHPRHHKEGFFLRIGLREFLPNSVSMHDYEYWQTRLFELYSRLKGLNETEAKLQYIYMASKKSLASLSFFSATYKGMSMCHLGIGEDGVFVFAHSEVRLMDTVLFKDVNMYRLMENGLEIVKEDEYGVRDAFVFMCSHVQALVIMDLITGYYHLLPDRFRKLKVLEFDVHLQEIGPEHVEEPFRREIPEEHASRLEFLKELSIDEAVDTDGLLQSVDLSYSELGGEELAVIIYCLIKSSAYTATNTPVWTEDMDLNTINMAHNRVSPVDAKELDKLFQHLDNLSHIDLNYNAIDNQGAMSLESSYSMSTKLHSIDLMHNNIGNKGIQSILRACKDHPYLTRIQISNNRIGPQSVELLCDLFTNAFHHINFLDVSFNQIGLDGLKDLCSALASNTTITELHLGGNTANTFGHSPVDAIVDLIEKNTTLKMLNVEQCDLGIDGAIRVTEALRLNDRITNLVLDSNNIGQNVTLEKAKKLLQFLEPALPLANKTTAFPPPKDLASKEIEIQRRRSMEEVDGIEEEQEARGRRGSQDKRVPCRVKKLSLGDNELDHLIFGRLLAESMGKSTCPLQEMVLRRNFLGGKEEKGLLGMNFLRKGGRATDRAFHVMGTLAVEWSEFLLKRCKLHVLDLSWNGLNTDGLRQVLAGLKNNTTVTSLSLAGNEIDSQDEVRSIANMFRTNNSNVKDIDFSYCNLKDGGAKEMGLALQTNTILEKLVLRQNKITVQGAKELGKYIQFNKTLRYLDISQNPLSETKRSTREAVSAKSEQLTINFGFQ